VTTTQPAHDVPGPVVPAPAIPGPATAPDRETLGRVLDGLRELDTAARPAPAAGTPGPADDAPAVPLPRRR
jgi:hypothetical protein